MWRARIRTASGAGRSSSVLSRTVRSGSFLYVGLLTRAFGPWGGVPKLERINNLSKSARAFGQERFGSILGPFKFGFGPKPVRNRLRWPGPWTESIIEQPELWRTLWLGEIPEGSGKPLGPRRMQNFTGLSTAACKRSGTYGTQGRTRQNKFGHRALSRLTRVKVQAQAQL